jgi:hypothetical protein
MTQYFWGLVGWDKAKPSVHLASTVQAVKAKSGYTNSWLGKERSRYKIFNMGAGQNGLLALEVYQQILVIILVNDQLDAQFFYLICLFQSSTCFEQPSARHQENQFYQYNVRYSSVCVSGRGFHDLHTRRSPTHSDIYQNLYWYNWFSCWRVLGCLKHVEDWNKHIRKKNCASSWSFTRIIPRCTVNRTLKKCVSRCYD